MSRIPDSLPRPAGRSQRETQNPGAARPPCASLDLSFGQSILEPQSPATRNPTPANCSSDPASQLHTDDQDDPDGLGNWNGPHIFTHPKLAILNQSSRKHIATTPAQSGAVSSQPSNTSPVDGDSVYSSQLRFASPALPAQVASPFASPPAQTTFPFAAPAQPPPSRCVDAVDTQASPLSSNNDTPPSTAAPEQNLDMRIGGGPDNDETQQQPPNEAENATTLDEQDRVSPRVSNNLKHTDMPAEHDC
jgi:hypothetical protein